MQNSMSTLDYSILLQYSYAIVAIVVLADEKIVLWQKKYNLLLTIIVILSLEDRHWTDNRVVDDLLWKHFIHSCDHYKTWGWFFFFFNNRLKLFLQWSVKNFETAGTWSLSEIWEVIVLSKVYNAIYKTCKEETA